MIYNFIAFLCAALAIVGGFGYSAWHTKKGHYLVAESMIVGALITIVCLGCLWVVAT